MQWCSLLIHTGFELMLHCRWSSWFDPCQPEFQMVVLLPFESYKICRLQVIRFSAGVVLQILIWCLDLYWRYILIQKQKKLIIRAPSQVPRTLYSTKLFISGGFSSSCWDYLIERFYLLLF
jgi:hypothetical protein